MAEPKRILIAGLTSETGGMESYVMNLYRHTDKNRLQFDFVNQNKNKKLPFSEEILGMGGRIYEVPYIRDGFFKHYRGMNDLFRNTRYEAIYYQANRKLRNADLFRYAFKYGVPHRILHSHNTEELDVGRLNSFRIKRTEGKLKKLLTDRFACSEEAGQWMFPGYGDVVVVKNGVDTRDFDYRPDRGMTIRRENGWENRKIFGTVGRICKEKNSLFLVEIFERIHEHDPEAIFVHIGGGNLEEQMGKSIREKGLEEHYLLAGRKNNVPDYLNAMDVLILPSLHEGFPITLVEAQCSGLCCLVSDRVTSSADITGNIYFRSVSDSPESWADTACRIAEYERRSCREILTQKGYDEQTVADRFTDYILG